MLAQLDMGACCALECEGAWPRGSGLEKRSVSSGCPAKMGHSAVKVTIRGSLGVVSSPKWSESERLEGEEAAWVSDVCRGAWASCGGRVFWANA